MFIVFSHSPRGGEIDKLHNVLLLTLVAQVTPTGSHDMVGVSVEVTNAGEREGDKEGRFYLRRDTSNIEIEALPEGLSRIHLNPHKPRP
jgi:hypothetical protein